jgi:hypothetical protein
MFLQLCCILTLLLGQRYHVVLDATPYSVKGSNITGVENFWIRAIPANGCAGFETGNQPDERQGILRYNESNHDVPTTFRRDTISLDCRDENYKNLKPVLNWTVTPVELCKLVSKLDV